LRQLSGRKCHTSTDDCRGRRGSIARSSICNFTATGRRRIRRAASLRYADRARCRHEGLAAAEAEAKKNDWLMVIAVVDSGGRLVAFSRMDNAQLGSIDIAMGKAMTANNLRRPTKALQASVVSGAASNQDAQCAIAGAAAAVGK
jgi:hypothetical protein